MMRKIYVFGNPLLLLDSQPIVMLPLLRKRFPGIEFIHMDPNENFPPHGETDIVILDTVQGIRKVMILDSEDLAGIQKTPVSPHDYDLLFHLLLLKKLRKITRVRIVGIPLIPTHDSILQDVSDLIATLL